MGPNGAVEQEVVGSSPQKQEKWRNTGISTSAPALAGSYQVSVAWVRKQESLFSILLFLVS